MQMRMIGVEALSKGLQAGAGSGVEDLGGLLSGAARFTGVGTFLGLLFTPNTTGERPRPEKALNDPTWFPAEVTDGELDQFAADAQASGREAARQALVNSWLSRTGDDLVNWGIRTGKTFPQEVPAGEIVAFYGRKKAETEAKKKAEKQAGDDNDGGKVVGTEHPHCGEWGKYGELVKKNERAKRANPDVFPQEAHHLPSFAAMRLEAERDFNGDKDLNPRQERELKNDLLALDLPTPVHRNTDTCGGKQHSVGPDGKTTVQRDSEDPRKAWEKDKEDVERLKFPRGQEKCRATTHASLKEMDGESTKEKIDGIKKDVAEKYKDVQATPKGNGS